MEARVSVAVALLLAAPVTASPSAAAGAAPPTKDQCIDANEAAQPLVRAGQLIAAREKLLVCVEASCPGPVRDDCSQRLADVQANTPTIVFVVKDDSDQDLSAVRVTIDGRPFLDRLDGTAVAVDPGEHQFTFEAAGLNPQRRTFVLHEGDKDRRERVVLAREDVPPPSAEPVVAAQPQHDTEPEAAPVATDGSAQRMAGLALGGAGMAGLLVGGVFGVLTKTTYDHALTVECNGNPNACSAGGIADGSMAHTQAVISTVGFVAGAALLAGGAYLYFTAPHDAGLAVRASMAPGGVGLEARCAW
jgi:hypothetical protein